MFKRKIFLDIRQDPLFLSVVSEASFERIETVAYFDSRFRKENNSL